MRNEKRIKLLGYISEEDKNKYLATCEALVFPTDYEAFGIVTLEASLFSKPIICSNLAVLSEILDKDGVIFFENNIKFYFCCLINFMEWEREEEWKWVK